MLFECDIIIFFLLGIELGETHRALPLILRMECGIINTKRGDLFINLVYLTKELESPHLIMDSILLSKEQLQE
jgi:hypothetical protein